MQTRLLTGRGEAVAAGDTPLARRSALLVAPSSVVELFTDSCTLESSIIQPSELNRYTEILKFPVTYRKQMPDLYSNRYTFDDPMKARREGSSLNSFASFASFASYASFACSHFFRELS